MYRAALVTALLLSLWACSHNKMDGHYECSYETTEEAYERCMEVAQGMGRETTQAAGKREP
ncbi:MAG TPA: hypothetical protein VIC08_00520 [Cellvibrionaceae bacterium]